VLGVEQCSWSGGWQGVDCYVGEGMRPICEGNVGGGVCGARGMGPWRREGEGEGGLVGVRLARMGGWGGGGWGVVRGGGGRVRVLGWRGGVGG